MQSAKNFARRVWTDVRSGRLSTTFAILAALSVGILAGSAFTGRVFGAQRPSVNSSDAQPIEIPNPVTLSNRFSEIVKQVGPAVVNINTEILPKHHQNAENENGDNDQDNGGDDNNNSMQDFFNHFFGFGGPQMQPQQQGPERALGSGIIVDPRGYIITNYHVIANADKIWVKLANEPDFGGPDGGQGHPATVIGYDKDTDIAVIKIDDNAPLPVAKLGNSDGAQVGDWVLAIGTPFGERNTVSAGIVSAKGRDIDEPGPDNISKSQFQRFIQTDAAINPGNSGGPLVDMAGQVIGMNTAIFTQSAGSEGIGFALPSNTIIKVYDDLIGPEHAVIRGSIGITFQANTSSAVSRMYGFANGGVLVGTVTPGGPAAKAGVEAGDAIVSVDGQSIKNGDELVNIISAKAPGSTVRLGVVRNGQHLTLECGIADRAKLFADIEGGGSGNGPSQGTDVGQAKLGITVQDLTPNQAQQLDLHNGGVVITSVRPGSFADEIGLQNGEVITEINRMRVSDDASYQNIVSKLKSGDDVVFVIHDPQMSGSRYIGGTLQ